MIDEIIEIEFEFMNRVQHIEGRASCQDDYDSFVKYRRAQFNVFYPEVLEGYYHDLQQYVEIDYNPIMLKYARMMETNDYQQYLQIKDQLPPIDMQVLLLINEIVEIELVMKEQFDSLYPNISRAGRVVYSNQDDVNHTSFETYLRSELSTYSPRTLYQYALMIQSMLEKQENIVTLIQQETVKLFGFASLQEAELHLKN